MSVRIHASVKSDRVTVQISDNLKDVTKIREDLGYRGKRSFACANGYEERLRRAWIDQFEPSAASGDKDSLRNLIRKCFDEDSTIWYDCQKLFPRAAEILNATMLPEAPILVPIMAGGYAFGSTVADALNNAKKKFDFVMLGCHRNYTTFGKVLNVLRSGKPLVPWKVYIHEFDEAFLHQNRERPLLILDDTYEKGRVLASVMKFMSRIGCDDIFLFVNDMRCKPNGFKPIRGFKPTKTNAMLYRYSK